jgi:hypothetical protein
LGRKRAGGLISTTYKGDHRPFHVHIQREGREIGRWDIENQRPFEDFALTRNLREALSRLGYLKEIPGK